MKENKYDDEELFAKFHAAQVAAGGLNSDWSWEWPYLRSMLPSLKGKRVLDLGCGLGWHCDYAIEQGAESVTGVEISQKMLEAAKDLNKHKNIQYVHSSIEDFDYPKDKYDVVMSSMALHYVEPLDEVCRKISQSLTSGGNFSFSVEHPTFTAAGTREWVPIENYFAEGNRDSAFLGVKLKKFHRMLSSYLKIPNENGLHVTDICEPSPSKQSVIDGTVKPDRLERPSVLIVQSFKDDILRR